MAYGVGFFSTASTEVVEKHFNPDGSGFKITRPYEGAPPSKISIVGPRLENLNVPFSTWGKVIPVSFGVKRLRGECIWRAPLDERRHKQTRTMTSADLNGGAQTPSFQLPGLGAPWLSPTVVKTYTYHYFGDWAVSLGQGDPDNVGKKIQQIYFDGKLVYDAGNPDVETGAFKRAPVRLFPDLRFTFHQGTETQMPDPTIQTFENRRYAEATDNPLIVNVVSPYRGQMYVVFEKVPLGPFGNTFPVVDVVLADVTEAFDFFGEYENLPAPPAGGGVKAIGPDWNQHFLYSYYDGMLLTVDLDSNSVVNTIILSLGDLGEVFEKVVYSQGTGKLYGTRDNGASGFQIYEIDQGTGFAEPFQVYQDSLQWGPYTQSFNTINNIVPVAYVDGGGNLVDEIYIIEATGGTNIYATQSPFPFYHRGSFFDLDNVLVPGPITSPLPTAFLKVEDNLIVKIVGHSYSDFYATTDDYTIASIIYIQQYGLLLVAQNSPGGTAGRLDAVLPTGLERLWRKEYSDPFVVQDGPSTYFHYSDTTGSTLLYPMSGKILEIDVRNGETIRSRTLSAPTTFVVSSAIYQAIFGLTESHYFDRLVVRRTNMRNFILFAARVAGIPDGMVTVQSTLSDIAIDGAYITNAGISFRTLLDNLKQAFLFDYREVDGVIQVIKKAPGEGPTDFTFIPSDMLRQDTDTEAQLPGFRQSSDLLPSRLFYYFLDFDLNYERNFVPAQRIMHPTKSTDSTQPVTLETPIVMRYNEAQLWAARVLFAYWSARNSFTALLPPKHLKYEPGDTGLVNIGSNIYPMKIKRVTYNADCSIQADMESFQPEGTYDFRLAYNTRDVQRLRPQTATQPLILDIPEIFANDSDFAAWAGGAPVYVTGYPQIATNEWAGGTVYLSVRGLGYELMGDILRDTLIKTGYSLNVLGPHGRNQIWSTDTRNPLTVKFGDDTFVPASITQDQWLTGEFNVLLYGTVPIAPNPATTFEIIVARDVVNNGDGTFTFSHLMRGRRGTEHDINLHTQKGRVIYVPQNAFFEKTLAVSDSFLPVSAAAVTYGGLETIAPRISTLPTFTGQAGKPFMPNHIRAEISGGKLVITWERQSRAPSPRIEFSNEAAEQPSLWEDIEKYGVAFYAFETDYDDDWQYDPENNGKIVNGLPLVELGRELLDDKTRGVESLDPQTCTVTSADWTEMFGFALPVDGPFYCDIAQYSANWGRGKGRRIILNVQ